MKTLIVYASHHGCTEECARRLQTRLGGGVDLVELRGRPAVDPAAYDRVVIGGSIQAGKIQGGVRNFCRQHLETLLTKPLGLFICCMAEGEQAQKQFDGAYPEVLRRHARATGLFGGAFHFEKMNVLQRAIIRKISGTSENVEKIRQEAIDDFLTRLSV